MSSTQNVIIGAYITAILAVFLVYPLVVMHGYRTWWVVLFYAVFVGAVIGGSISHYRIVRRNRRADPQEPEQQLSGSVFAEPGPGRARRARLH